MAFELVEAAAVVLSVLIGGVLSYLSAILLAKAERHYDVKLERYSQLIAAASDAKDAVLAHREVAMFNPDPKKLLQDAFEGLHKVISVVPSEKLLELRNAKNPDSKRQGKNAPGLTIKQLKDRLQLLVAQELEKMQAKFQEAIVPLRIIGSPTLESEAYTKFTQDFAKVANSALARMAAGAGLSSDVEAADSAAAEAAERIDQDLDELVKEVSREMKRVFA